MYQQYSGKRRYSNYSATVGGFTLAANPADPTMGDVRVTDITLFDEESTESINHANDRAAQAAAKTFSAATGSHRRFSVRAVPKQGFRFVSWDGNYPTGHRQSPTVQVTLDRNVTLTANFERLPETYRTVKVHWNASMGAVANPSLNDGRIVVRSGDYVTLTASARSGYRFVKWTGGPSTVGGKTAATVGFNANNDYDITAVFEADSPLNPGGTPDDPGTIITGGNGGTGGNPAGSPYVPNAGGTPSPLDAAIAFAKKWWWALLIAACLVYDFKKGGPK